MFLSFKSVSSYLDYRFLHRRSLFILTCVLFFSSSEILADNHMSIHYGVKKTEDHSKSWNTDVVFTLNMQSQKEEDGMVNGKINLCNYDAKSIEELEKILEQKILGRYQVDLVSFFENTPYKPARKKTINPKLHQLTGVQLGQFGSIIFRCPVENNNINEWLIFILEDEEGILTKFEIHLLYIDEDFSRRNEPLLKHRFSTRTQLVTAINSLKKVRSFTREEFRREMLSGGFLLHRSCQLEGRNADVYIDPPQAPDSINALLGIYLSPNVRPNVSAVFSDENNFLYAEPALGKGTGGCSALWDLYNEQSQTWLLKNYPDSWFSKLSERRKNLNK